MDAFNFAKQTALSIKRPSNGAANNAGVRNTRTNVNGVTRGKHPPEPAYRKHNLLEEYWNKLVWVCAALQKKACLILITATRPAERALLGAAP